MVRVLGAKGGKSLGGTAIGQAAARFQIRQQHGFAWIEDFGGLGHEVHPAKDDHLGGGGGGFAGQLQGIANHISDVLDCSVLVVVGQDHSLLLLLERGDGCG